MNAKTGKTAGLADPSAARSKAQTEKPDPGDTLSDSVLELDAGKVVPADQPTIEEKVKTLLVGKPLDLGDSRVFRHVSLVAFLAWVGLGADGLSSSCYGPSEAFHHLHGHHHLAIFLALATMFTVVVISLCYTHIIEAFPSGGGGYLVASKMLGRPFGVVSGCALVVDYVLTVTTSIAAASDALMGLAGPEMQGWKMPLATGAILLLIVLNLRGVKESVTILLPIFLVFLVTHAILIAGSIGLHLTSLGRVFEEVQTEVQRNVADPKMGLFGMIGILLYAYSLGAGTYTGIEAVSNSMPVMREPKVATAQRTMIYMAISLALTAGGLMLAYLLLGIVLPENPTVTMNQLLTEKFVSEIGLPRWLGLAFILITMISEGAILFVAAQAGFIDGPRVLANMAHDSYVPHWFGSLSERLAAHNGILLIGGAALAALWATDGQVSTLLVMYSINVFLTFSLSMIGMSAHWWQLRGKDKLWWRRFALFAFGTAMCLSILAVTVYYKFEEGGWRTIAVTSLFAGTCFVINRYYKGVTKKLKGLDESLGTIEIKGEPNLTPPDPNEHTAVILVGGYSGLGVHTLLNSVRFVPNHFKNMIFISVGVVDSGNFKGAEEVDHLRRYTESSLEKYVDLARRLGFPSRAYLSIGTDVVDELEQLCRAVHRDFPKSVVFAGQLVFQRETWYGALLHNQTAYSLQRRLQWDGVPMVILPTRVRER
jgi:amino acid transporter